MADEPNIKLDVPYFVHEPQQHMRAIKWCEGHWAELMFALKDRNLENQIAENADELTQKFQRGELDPCWEATNMINMGALECFGPDRCMFGSDWPVCELAATYSQVYEALVEVLGPLSDSETNAIFGETARRFYGLEQLPT